jgi:hypothetical protein
MIISSRTDIIGFAYHVTLGLDAQEDALSEAERRAFAAFGEPIIELGGLFGATYASNVLNFTNNVTAGDSTVIGSRTYNFVAALTSGADQVLVGATKLISSNNLFAALTGGLGIGTTYGAGTTVNESVTSALNTGGVNPALTVTAITPGTAGNSVVATESSSGLAWSNVNGHLNGGTDSTITPLVLPSNQLRFPSQFPYKQIFVRAGISDTDTQPQAEFWRRAIEDAIQVGVDEKLSISTTGGGRWTTTRE